MTRPHSRPLVGAMGETIFSRVTAIEKDTLQSIARSNERSVSWIIRDALFKSGYLAKGK
jgi:predicted transcriptional regulator